MSRCLARGIPFVPRAVGWLATLVHFVGLGGCITSPVGTATRPAAASPPLGQPPDPAEVAARYSGPAPLELSAAERALTLAAVQRLHATLREFASDSRIALGHEDTTAYGVGWSGDPDRSDVKSVCGSHAAVHGWDLFRIEIGATHNGDGVPFDLMRSRIQQAYRAGSINTISWHVDNPASGRDAWDTTRAVEKILPGRSHHEVYRVYLDRVADYLQSLRGPDGELIPILFRPFHEANASWFWWGANHSTAADYVALWQFTVNYLTKQRQLANLLFAYSPAAQGIESADDYLARYPGDEYVDVLGLDDYYLSGSAHLVQLLEVIVTEAEARGKIAALTEFGPRLGVGMLPGRNWYTSSFFTPLQTSPTASRIAYALAWRNADEHHAFLPYPDHRAASGLKKLCADPRVLLARDLTPPPRATETPMPSPLSSPRTKDYEWMSIAEWERRRQKLLAIPKTEREAARLVFIGDSITEGWDDATWNEHFARYGALRLGIGGDTTANVLYRMEHGEFEHVTPDAVVLLIGTNDLGNEGATPDQCAAGIRAIVEALRTRWPDARVVLLAILPRDQRPTDAGRRSVEATNRLIADLGNDPLVRWVDLQAQLLERDGTLSPAIMADFLHPTPLGYERIANALDPILGNLLGSETRR